MGDRKTTEAWLYEIIRLAKLGIQEYGNGRSDRAEDCARQIADLKPEKSRKKSGGRDRQETGGMNRGGA